MNDQEQSEIPDTKVNIKGIGCSFIFLGILGIIFSVDGLLGIIKNLELEFFGIELNSQRGRVFWIVGCAFFSAVGILLMKMNKKQPNRSL